MTLLERSAFVGGAAASREVAGVRVDLGSHRLHPTIEPRILAELRALLGDDLQTAAAARPHPPRRAAGSPSPCARWTWCGACRRAWRPAALRDSALGPLRRPPRADTFSEVLMAALGPTLCERFYFPYARKIWGVDPAELAGEQARRRVGARSPGRMVARAMRAGGARASARSSTHAAATGRSGRRWPTPARGPGVDLVLRRPSATSLSLSTDGAVAGLSDGRTIAARRVWSTIPLTALARMASPAAPPEALAAGGGAALPRHDCSSTWCSSGPATPSSTPTTCPRAPPR